MRETEWEWKERIIDCNLRQYTLKTALLLCIAPLLSRLVREQRLDRFRAFYSGMATGSSLTAQAVKKPMALPLWLEIGLPGCTTPGHLLNTILWRFTKPER